MEKKHKSWASMKWYYTSISLCFSGTSWAPEDTFAFRRPSWAFLCLTIPEPKHTLGIHLTTWQRVPQNRRLSCTFPVCHLTIWDSPNPHTMSKCGYLFPSHPFHATQDFTVFCPDLFRIMFFPALISWGLCRSHSTSLSILATFHCTCCNVKQGSKNRKFQMGGTEVFYNRYKPINSVSRSRLETWQPQPGTG